MVAMRVPARERPPLAVPHGALELRKTDLEVRQATTGKAPRATDESIGLSFLKAPEATGSSKPAPAPGGICTGQLHIDPGRFLPEAAPDPSFSKLRESGSSELQRAFEYGAVVTGCVIG